MKRRFTASVTQEGQLYVAQCLEVDVASQGMTKDEALANLREALELYFDAPMPTLKPEVRAIAGRPALLRPLPYREVRRRREAAGFTLVSQKGSHVKFAKRPLPAYTP